MLDTRIMQPPWIIFSLSSLIESKKEDVFKTPLNFMFRRHQRGIFMKEAGLQQWKNKIMTARLKNNIEIHPVDIGESSKHEIQRGFE